MKQAFYFSHDSNARHDPKILDLRTEYGYQGYGWYWALIEMLRDQDNYSLEKNYGSIALELHCSKLKAEQFINDCINKFHLFNSDGNLFFSESLCRRMESFENKSLKAIEAANKRWHKSESNSNANALPTHYQRNALEIKSNQIKSNNIPELPPTPTVNQSPSFSNIKNTNNFSEKESDRWITDKNLSAIVTCYENNIGMITPVMADELKSLSDEFLAEWFAEATKEALNNNARSLSYIKKILGRWRVQGFKAPFKGGNGYEKHNPNSQGQFSPPSDEQYRSSLDRPIG